MAVFGLFIGKQAKNGFSSSARMIGYLFKIAAVVVVGYYGFRFLYRLFRQQGKVYYLTPMRQLGLVFWSLISFWVALSMFGLLLRDQTNTALERGMSIALGLVLAMFSLPTFLVHFQYWRHERENALELEKDNGTALVATPGQNYLLTPANIRLMEETKCAFKGVFWAPYRYLTVHLTDGRTLRITSLLIDLEILKALWPKAAYQLKTKWVCFL